MSRTDVFNDLNEIFLDVLDLDEVNLTAATTAEDIEEWDSLSHVRLIVAIERQYGIRFSNKEIESLKTVGHLADIILAKTT